MPNLYVEGSRWREDRVINRKLYLAAFDGHSEIIEREINKLIEIFKAGGSGHASETAQDIKLVPDLPERISGCTSPTAIPVR